MWGFMWVSALQRCCVSMLSSISCAASLGAMLPNQRPASTGECLHTVSSIKVL